MSPGSQPSMNAPSEASSSRPRSTEDGAGAMPAAAAVVVELPAERYPEWDAYVTAAPEATFFHRIGWMRAVRDVYGHRPRYFAARDPESGRICGILPLVAVSGPLTGRALVSIPYAV